MFGNASLVFSGKKKRYHELLIQPPPTSPAGYARHFLRVRRSIPEVKQQPQGRELPFSNRLHALINSIGKVGRELKGAWGCTFG